MEKKETKKITKRNTKINFKTNPPSEEEVKSDYIFTPIYLQVKYEERIEAKSLGAFFSPEYKSWYVPNNKVKASLIERFKIKNISS